MSTSAFRMIYQEIPRKHRGESYSFQFLTVNGTPAVTFSVISGALPTGASLSTSGALTYSGDATGKYTFEVQAVDGALQTISQTYVLDVYGELFSSLKINQFPRRVIDAVDTVQNINATDAQVARHFARVPDPKTDDYAHDANDIYFDTSEGTKEPIQTSLSNLFERPIGVPTTVTASAANGFEIVSSANDLFEVWVPQPAEDAPFFLNTDNSNLDAIFFYMELNNSSELTTTEGLRYTIVRIDIGYSLQREVLLYGSNHVDGDGFFNGTMADGKKLDDDERGFWLLLQPYDGLAAPTAMTLPFRILGMTRQLFKDFPPDVLLESLRVKVAAEGKGLNPAASPVTAINGQAVGVTGNQIITPGVGLSVTNPATATMTIDLDAAINSIPFSDAAGGDLTIKAGNFVSIANDSGSQTITVNADPGIATLNGQSGDDAKNFLLVSGDGSISFNSSAGQVDIRVGLPVANAGSSGVMSSAQAVNLATLSSGQTTSLHKHDGDTIRMGSTVNANNGVISFTADSSVVEVISAINDFLKTQFVPLSVAVLNGKSLSSAVSLYTALIPRDSVGSPIGLNFSVPGTLFVPGASCTRVIDSISGDIEFTVGPFLDAESGTLAVLVNGASVDSITFTGSAGTINGSNSILSAEVTTISGLSLLQCTATITLSRTDDLELGYNNIVLRHTFGSEVRDSAGYRLFRDPNGTDAVVSNLDIGSSVAATYLSGVLVYPSTAYLTVSADITNLATATLNLQPLDLDVDGTQTLIDWNDSAIQGYTDNVPAIDDAVQLTNKVTTTLMGSLVGNEEISLAPVDQLSSNDGTVTVTLGSDYNLVRISSAWGGAGTYASEQFNNETYRVKSSTTSDYASVPQQTTPVGAIRLYKWVSSDAITVGSAPWGEASVAEAQWYNGRMNFPSTDYSAATYRPASVDYSGLSPSAVYSDRIFVPTKVHTDVIIDIGGIAVADLGNGYYATSGSPTGDVNVEVKVPGGVWLDAVRASTNVFAANGAGARLGTITSSGSGVSIRVTLGGQTISEELPLIVRVTMRNAAKQVTSVTMKSIKGGTY